MGDLFTMGSRIFREPMPKVDLSESQGPRIIAVSITSFTLGMIAMILRFLSRKVGKVGIKLDDWLIVFAMVCNATV